MIAIQVLSLFDSLLISCQGEDRDDYLYSRSLPERELLLRLMTAGPQQEDTLTLTLTLIGWQDLNKKTKLFLGPAVLICIDGVSLL